MLDDDLDNYLEPTSWWLLTNFRFRTVFRSCWPPPRNHGSEDKHGFEEPAPLSTNSVSMWWEINLHSVIFALIKIPTNGIPLICNTNSYTHVVRFELFECGAVIREPAPASSAFRIKPVLGWQSSLRPIGRAFSGCLLGCGGAGGRGKEREQVEAQPQVPPGRHMASCTAGWFFLTGTRKVNLG